MALLDNLIEQRVGMVPYDAPRPAARPAPAPTPSPAAPAEPTFMERVNKFFKNPDNVAKFIMALEPMKPSFSRGGAAATWAGDQLKVSQAQSLLEKQGNKTADALENAGHKELAGLVRSNPALAKDALAVLTKSPSNFAEAYAALRKIGKTEEEAVMGALSSRGTTINMPSVGTIPPGYRAKYDDSGNVVSMEPVPGGPVQSEAEQEGAASESSYAAYNAGIEALSKAFGQANTGSLVGLLPAFTSGDLTFEGIKDVMLQPLKSIFRGKGEGTFTDADAAQLMSMLPTRRDTPESAAAKLEAADMVIRAKLNLPLAQASSQSTPPGVTHKWNPETGKIEPIGTAR